MAVTGQFADQLSDADHTRRRAFLSVSHVESAQQDPAVQAANAVVGSAVAARRLEKDYHTPWWEAVH